MKIKRIIELSFDTSMSWVLVANSSEDLMMTVISCKLKTSRKVIAFIMASDLSRDCYTRDVMIYRWRHMLFINKRFTWAQIYIKCHML
jgi:hypothetical protein